MGVTLKRIEEQVVVITGASSGIGLATAKMAAERGARVVLAARDADGLASARVEIEGSGGRAITVIADVSVFEDVRSIARRAIGPKVKLNAAAPPSSAAASWSSKSNALGAGGAGGARPSSAW